MQLVENLADNGGLERSYETQKLSIETNQETADQLNKKLPGLSEYTMDQLFYISFVQLFIYLHHILRENFKDLQNFLKIFFNRFSLLNFFYQCLNKNFSVNGEILKIIK